MSVRVGWPSVSVQELAGMRVWLVCACVGACGRREVGMVGREFGFVAAGLECVCGWCAVCEGLLGWLQADAEFGGVHV